MDRIVNVSDRGNAAIHALALAAAQDGRMTAAACARSLRVSPSYLAKVLQVLVRGGLLSSTRGAAGGFELARDPAAMSCLEVLELVDGPLPDRECLFRETVCPPAACVLQAMCAQAVLAVRETLASTSIRALAASFEKSCPASE
jgi:Rrf2 family protein